jgi:protocatechuate 3,4-dioxygenase beta subunit
MQRAALPILLSLSALAGILLATPSANGQLSISGRIELPSGEPAAGVEVELTPEIGFFDFGLLVFEGHHQPEPAARALTREDGSFELQAPEPGMWRVSVVTEGYRPVQVYFHPLFESQIVPPLELTAETPVEVRVLDSEGRPAAGARVMADAPSEARRFGLPDTWRAMRRQAFADEKGVAVLSRAADEALQLAVRYAGHLKSQVASVESAAVTVRLGAAHVLPIQVVGPRGQPTVGAQLLAGKHRWPIGLTDADGLISLPMPAEDQLWIRIITRDGSTAEQWVKRADWKPGEPTVVTLTPPIARNGRLIDRETKRPLAGALAWLVGDAAGFVRTDSGGGYSLAAQPGKDIWVWGAAVGYLKEGAQSASGAATGPTLALQRSVRATGVVVDEGDRPLEGVEVVPSVDLTRRGGRTSIGASRQLERAISDAQGRFSIGSLHPEVSYLLSAEEPGFAKAELSLPHPGSDTTNEIRLVLEAGRTATGTVVGPSGEPVPGARVLLKKSPSGGNPREILLAQMMGRQQELEAFADATGRFTVRDLGVGAYSLEATAAGYAKARTAAVEVVDHSPQTDLGEVVLELGVTIEGRVTDVEGAPIEGAQVRVAEHANQRRFMAGAGPEDHQPAAFSDTNGFFAVEDLAIGEKVDLTVEMNSFATARLPGIEAPTSRPLAVRMERASSVRGQVVDASGRAVAGAELSIQVNITTGSMSVSSTGGSATSDENGLFVIENVDAGELQLSARADGYRVAELKSLTVEPGKDLEDVRITMEPGAAVAGRVTDPSGRPVPSAHLMVMEKTRTGFAGGFSNFARTDGEGRYRLEGVAPGPRSITVRHEEYEPVTKELEVQLGGNSLDFAFSGGAEISGRVIDEAGAPIAGAHVSVDSGRGSMWGSQREVSDTSGAFSLGGLSEGAYTLRAEQTGFSPGVLEDLQIGPAGLSGVEIRLSPGHAIVGQLYGLENGDYTAVEIFAFNRPKSWGMGTIGPGGSYRVEDLAPGQYTVSAEVAPSGLTASDEIEIFPGASETVLDLYFKAGLTLTGQVLKGGEPLRGAYLSLSGIDVSSRGGGNSDNEGRFQIRGIEPGRHMLTVNSYQTGLDYREELDIPSSRDVVVRISTSKVSGLVLDANDSRPLVGASVRMEPLDHADTPGSFRMSASVTSDSSGFFRISEAAAGSYRLVTVKDGYAPVERDIVVSDGLDQELEFLMTPTEGIRVFVTLPSGRPANQFSASVVDSSGQALTTALHNADEQGGAQLSIPPGSWELFVAAEGTAVWSSPINVPSEPMGISLSNEAILTVSVPELEGTTVLAQVRVTGSDGRPHRSIRWIWNTDSWPLARGKAIIPGLAPGSWNVQVEAPDGRVWLGQANLGAGENPEVVLR